MRFTERIGLLLLPIARLWIRYMRIPLFKKILWHNFGWRSKNFIVSTQFGSRISGQSHDRIQGYIYFFGIWEPNLTFWIRERLKDFKDGIFVDVGANIGWFTLLAAKELGANGHVVSIEASPMIYKMLVNNIKLNELNNVRSICCAAMSEKGYVPLYHATSDNIGKTTTVHGQFNDENAIKVIGMPLSEILNKEEVEKIKLIKIDVEGAEWSTLVGLIPVFDKFPLDIEFIVEVTPEKLQPQALSPETIINIFKEKGFNSYIIENSYDPFDYLIPAKVIRPERINGVPNKQADIIFSRVDAEYL